MSDEKLPLPPPQAPRFLESRRGVRTVLWALHAAALAAVLVELLVPLDPAHGAERTQVLEFLASFAAYGFIACVALVLLGRVLRWVVMRREDYWSGDGR